MAIGQRQKSSYASDTESLGTVKPPNRMRGERAAEYLSVPNYSRGLVVPHSRLDSRPALAEPGKMCRDSRGGLFLSPHLNAQTIGCHDIPCPAVQTQWARVPLLERH